MYDQIKLSVAHRLIDFSQLELLGVGVRAKVIGPVKVNVYSAGLYMNKSIVKRACSSVKCKSESELFKSKDFETTVWDIYLVEITCNSHPV
jgi:hypothetical protein